MSLKSMYHWELFFDRAIDVLVLIIGLVAGTFLAAFIDAALVVAGVIR